MRSGKLRFCVSLQRRTTIKNVIGEPVTDNWTDLKKKIYIDIQPLNGREFFRSGEVQADITHEITTRLIEDILVDDRFVYKETRFLHIRRILGVDERRRQLKVLCNEVLTTGLGDV